MRFLILPMMAVLLFWEISCEKTNSDYGTASNYLDYTVAHFYNPASGGIWDWPEGGLYTEWTDSAAWSAWTILESSNPSKHENELRGILNFLLNMKAPSQTLFYDYQEYGSKNDCGQIEFQVYRSALAGIVLLKGRNYFLGSDPAFALKLEKSALEVGNWQQDRDGGWLSTYNPSLRHKTLRDNAAMLIFLLEEKKINSAASQSKIDSTLRWILGMQDEENYGFHSAEENDFIYPAQPSDQNAIAVWAISEYDKFFGADHSREIKAWSAGYFPYILDNKIYGSDTEWCFKPELNASLERYVYISGLMSLALNSLGDPEKAEKCLNWAKNNFLNTSGKYENGFGVGYLNGAKVTDVNSETHPIVTLAVLLNNKKPPCENSQGAFFTI